MRMHGVFTCMPLPRPPALLTDARNDAMAPTSNAWHATAIDPAIVTNITAGAARMGAEMSKPIVFVEEIMRPTKPPSVPRPTYVARR